MQVMPPAPPGEPNDYDNEEFDLIDEHADGDKEENVYASQADYDDLMQKGLAYLNRDMDQSGRDALTPEDHGYSLFLRLQTLKSGPNMDMNEYYELHDILDGALQKVQAPRERNAEGKNQHHEGFAGKKKWADKLITALQESQEEEEALKRPRSEDGNVKKHPKKKESRGGIGIERRIGGPKEAHKETEKTKGRYVCA
jgi:hypothetical protein